MSNIQNIRKFFKSVHNKVNDINNISHKCTIEELDINDVPVYIDDNKENAYIEVAANLYRKANNSLGQYINITVNDRYYFKKAFITNIQHIAKDFEHINLEIKLNEYYYGAPGCVNMSVLNLTDKIHSFDVLFEAGSLYSKFLFQGHNIHLAIIGKKLYIYSEDEVEEEEFLKITNAIKTAIGFLSCSFIGEKEIYLRLSGNMDGFKNIEYLKSYPMTSNKNLDFDIFPLNLTATRIYFEHHMQKEICRLSLEQFCELCNIIYSKEHIQTAISYISDSASSRLQLSNKLVLLACAFEAVTREVRSSQGEKIIDDDKLFEKIKKTAMTAIKDFFDKHDEIDSLIKERIQEKLPKKISNFITNGDKYNMPFEIYNIPKWSKEEKKVIEKRNNMFHGEPFTYENDIETDILKYLYHTRIYYYYIYVIILKMISYDGWIINIRLWDKIVLYHNSFFNKMQNNSSKITDFLDNTKAYNQAHEKYEKNVLSEEFKNDYIVNLDFTK